MSENSKYIIGDSRNIKQIFEENKIQKPNVIISSPPYFDVLNYNNNQQQIGYGQKNYNEYLDDVCKIFQDCFNLASKKASFWLIVDTFKKDGVLKTLPFDIVSNLSRLNKKTWLLKEVIIWDKEKNLPWNGHGHFKNQFEYILFFTKSQDFHFSIDEVREINDLKKWWKTYPERYNPNGKAPSNIWPFTTALRGWGHGKQEHLCPLPFPLIEKILTISSKKDDLIFDPFAGSGSVLALAEVMGRQAVGIDVNEEYKDLFNKQIKTGSLEYWKKREDEIANNQKYIFDFKNTNKILRFHKVTSLIIEELIDFNSDSKFKSLIHCSNSNSKDFDLFIISENTNIIIPEFSESTNKVLNQSKVNPQIKIINFEEFTVLKHLKPLKFYKYTSKIYCYTSTTSYKTLVQKNIDKNEHVFYSMFSLKLK